MNMSIKMTNERQPLSMSPVRFSLWLFIATIVMLFAALTSAFIVRRGEGNWMEFNLPTSFMYNTLILVVSSVTIQLAYMAAKKDLLVKAKMLLVATFLLGIAFLIGQYLSWGDLVKQDVYFVGNPSGSFVYVFTGLHGFHIVSSLLFVLVVIIKAFLYKVHSKRLTTISMCNTYWHFLGGLWLYLYFFLMLNL